MFKFVENMANAFNGKYALVTGAASGMGRIYALRLADMGYGLILADINEEALDSLCDSIEEVPVVQVCIDLARRDAAAELGRIAAANDAVVEILINNAGVIFTSPICDTAPDKLGLMMDLHCTTPLLLCREFVPGMKEAGCGYVLNISSICAWMPWPIIGMYGNTKRFVKGYSRSLRIECRGSGVSVTTAIFGAVDTPLFGFSEKATRIMLRTGVMISPEKAVDRALKAMLHRRRRIIPGFVNSLAIPLVSILPDGLLKFLADRFGKYLSRSSGR